VGSTVTGLRRMGSRLSWGTRQVGVVRATAGIARLSALAVRRPEHAEVHTTRDGLNIGFRYPAQLIPTLVVFGDLLEPELGLLASVLGPGSVAVDVGASIGTWAMSAAHSGATVHACEPDPVNLEVLRANIRANGLLSRVSVYSAALGVHDGQGSLVSADRRYLNRVSEVPAAGYTGRECPVRTLDRFVDELGVDQVDVLKVNTAGGELPVMLGALGLFRAGRIRLAMVLDGLEVRPFLDELRACSYDIGVYDGKLRRFVPVSQSRELDRARPSPMNRYAILRRAGERLPGCVTEPGATSDVDGARPAAP
jgi:FkbM family methyltransferase